MAGTGDKTGKVNSTNTTELEENLEESSWSSIPVKHHPVDKGWAWIIMIGVFVIHFLTTGYLRSFGLLFVEFQNYFNSSSTVTALMNGIQMLSYSVTTFFTMNFGIKYVSVKTSCLVGCVFELISVASNSLVADVKQLLITHGVLYGIGQALIYCPSMVILSEYFEQKRPMATVIATGGVSAGGVIVPLLISYFIENYGLRGGLLLIAGVIFQQAVFVSLFTAPSDYKPASETNSEIMKNDTYLIKAGLGNDTHDAETKDRFNENGFAEAKGKVNDNKIILELCSETECSATKNTTYNEISTYQNVGLTDFKDNNQSSRSYENIANATHFSPLLNHDDNEMHKSQIVSPEIHSNLLSPCHDGTASTAEHHRSLPRSNLMRHTSHESVKLRTNRSRTQSLLVADTLVRAMSTSSVDVLGNVQPISRAGSIGSTRRRNHRSSTINSHDKHDKTQPTRTKLPSCHLPAMMKLPAFWLLALYFSSGGISSSIPTIFLPPLAKSMGMSELQSSYLLVISAVMEMFGRLAPGLILHFGYMRPSTVVIPSLICGGLLLQAIRLFQEFQTLLICSGLIGLFNGAFWSMQVLLVIEVIGMESLGPALGFYSMVLGSSIGFGFPLIGALADASGDYIVPYHCLGGAYLIAALSAILLQFTHRPGSSDDVCDEDDECD